MQLFPYENNFRNVLENLEFSLNAPISQKPEIVFVSNPQENLHPKHYIALEFAKNLEADAVYFRYYDDNRFCVPQVYFYDNNLTERNTLEIAEIHKKVYSSCQVPLICFINNIEISMFDCRIPVSGKKIISNKDAFFAGSKINNLEKIKEYFSAKKLNYGLFWESEKTSNHFLNNQSAYEKLIDVLTEIRNDFIKSLDDNKISIDFADDLLFKCILVKYLEENGKDDSHDYIREFCKRNKLGDDSLTGFLRNKNIAQLFAALENHFNGGVFQISELENNILQALDLSSLAELLEGYLSKNKQLSLWKIYSFKDIPIELISNFYEEFIPKNKENQGTVYTPSFLVNLLIDECLPLSNLETNYKIKLIDVSCGSGIFITSAFKRLVQRWRIAKGKNGKPLEKKDIRIGEIKYILTNYIYGVDKNETAVKLSKFSLQLAFCQIVPNNELWKWSDDKVFEKIFQDLNSNVVKSDFFDFLIERKEEHNSFDLVIGNPPFEALKENKDEKEYSTITKKLYSSLGFEFSSKIPDNQLALMFLEVSALLLKDDADLCFIQKSTSILYNKRAKQFRDNLFNNFFVHQIIDFTLLSRVLFKGTTVESCAVFYKKKKLLNYSTFHIVSRLLNNTKKGLSFEFDFYDFYEIPKEKILSDSTIWRCNLLGGNRLNNFIEKLNIKNSLQSSFTDYLVNEINVSTDSFSEGFMKGTPKGEITGKNKFCPFIIRKPFITAKNFESEEREFFETTQKFYYFPKEIAFKKNLIIIKEEINNGGLQIRLLNEDTAFDSRFVGVSNLSKSDCKLIFNKLKKNERINSLKTIATCSQFYNRGKTAIQKQDIDNWTIPLKQDKIEISKEEEVIVDDILDYIYPAWYKGNDAEVNKKDVTIPQLENFAEIFNESFNNIYKQNNKEQFLKKIIKGRDFFALEFLYDDIVLETEIIESQQEIDIILKNYISENAVVNRIMKIYGKNTITFLKPKNLRYWLKSIALRDADDVFDDIIEKGLK